MASSSEWALLTRSLDLLLLLRMPLLRLPRRLLVRWQMGSLRHHQLLASPIDQGAQQQRESACACRRLFLFTASAPGDRPPVIRPPGVSSPGARHSALRDGIVVGKNTQEAPSKEHHSSILLEWAMRAAAHIYSCGIYSNTRNASSCSHLFMRHLFKHESAR